MHKKEPQPVVSPAIEPLFIDIRSAALRLGVTVWCIRNLVWAKTLRPVKHGRKYLFSPADLIALSERLREGSVTFPAGTKTRKARRAA